MRLTIEPTERFVDLGPQEMREARVWTGVDEAGRTVSLLIVRVASPEGVARALEAREAAPAPLKRVA